MNPAQKVFAWKEKNIQKLVKKIPGFITPNLLTVLRAILSLPVILLLINKKYEGAVVIFVLAYLSDLLDGPLARIKNKVSLFGKLADPLADKILFLPVLIIIGPQFLPVYLILIIFILDVILIFLALLSVVLAKLLKINFKIGANIFGKIKFALQTAGAALLLLNLLNHSCPILTNIIFWLAAWFALLSIAGHLFSLKK
jgi:CDP-diacylglycerol--glycerol-3-phosphate 3-phosphatidyltransferase